VRQWEEEGVKGRRWGEEGGEERREKRDVTGDLQAAQVRDNAPAAADQDLPPPRRRRCTRVRITPNPSARPGPSMPCRAQSGRSGEWE
jgi:hypothetical protein